MEQKLHKIQFIVLRDHLFDKYLASYDKYEKWKKGKVDLAIGRVTGKKQTKAQMIQMIEEHLAEISKDLRELDQKICSFDSAEDIYVKIKEVY